MKTITFNFPDNLYSDLERIFPDHQQLEKQIKRSLEEKMLFEDYKKASLDPEREKLSQEWDDMEIADWNKYLDENNG